MVRYGDVCETHSDGSIPLFDQGYRIGLSGWDIHLGKRLAAKEWQSPNSGRGERNCAQEYVRWDAAKIRGPKQSYSGNPLSGDERHGCYNLSC